MLRKINAGKVESDEGFFVHIIGLEQLKYSENDKSVIVDWTYNQITQKISVFTGDVKLWSTPHHKAMLKSEKEKMIRNIKAATMLLDGDFELI